MTKQQRVEEANRVILAVSAYGRRFFYSGPGGESTRKDKSPEGRVARFELDDRGAIWFRDDYSWERIYVAYKGRWKHFSHGGTMKSLVSALRDYIRTGKPISPGHFGPWDQWLCDGDLWGYGLEQMALVQADVRKTQAVAVPVAV